MATVSEQLRHARERQQLDIYQVAELTKIKTDHLRALESGNFEVFSAPVYVRGFIRTYATMLKLDPVQLLKDLESEQGQNGKLREPAPLTSDKRGSVDFLMLQLSRMNWRTGVAAVAVLIFLVLAVALVRNRLRRPVDPLKDLGPTLYQSKPGRSGETLPLPSPPPPGPKR
jgi:cytoskeletal protein RodZ